MSIDNLLVVLNTQPITIDALSDRLRDIEGRLVDGLKLTHMLSLDPDEAIKFNNAAPFGERFAAQFPTVIYEIDEATKCLALSRSTAAVFHALRCLEAGIAALSRCLDIPDPTKAHERSWMKLLDKMDAGIKAKWPSVNGRMDGDGRFFEEAYAALAAMQNPWRNSTMHLDQKYTSEEAQEIFDAVRRFMVRVSNRMDESGQPKA